MHKPERRRTGQRKQDQSQVQIQTTEHRRAGMDGLEVPPDRGPGPGAPAASRDLGPDDEADGDDLLDDADDGADGAAPDDAAPAGDGEDEPAAAGRRFVTADLIGSRPPVVLLRVAADGPDVVVRRCATGGTRDIEAVELLRNLVQQCFRDGRASLNETEWAELIGEKPAPITRRLLLLLRLAIRAGDKVRLGEFGEESGPAFTPHDIGLERFANKFAALPDGTPFSVRLLLLDQRGRDKGDHYFDLLPDTVRLMALRRALRRERESGVAVSDNEFRDAMRRSLAELLGTPVPKPTEDQVRRRLRDHFKRKGLVNEFPNQAARQREYDRLRAEEHDEGSSGESGQ